MKKSVSCAGFETTAPEKLLKSELVWAGRAIGLTNSALQKAGKGGALVRVVRFLFTAFVAAAAFFVGFNWLEYGRVKGASSPVEFESFDGARFHGTLFTPHSKGPHRAVVILHGSGQASGIGFFVSGHANTFLKRGIAVLVYDKRGSGRSGGDFETATYADFINDAIAAVGMLRARDDIVADQIGLLGTSESGWLTPEIAKRAGGISFIINRAGPPISWIDTNLWEIRNELIEAGLRDEKEIAEFLGVRERIWRYYEAAATAKDPLPALRAELEAELERIDPRWIEATGMRLAEYDQKNFERYLVDILYDPTPFWESLEIPALAIHGGEDQNVPSTRAIAAYERLRKDFGKEIEVVIYPGYRHALAKYHNLLSMGYPPDYLPLVGRWADEHFDRRKNGDGR